MAVNSTITIYRGQNITFTATANVPTNVTGWTVAFTIRPRFGLAITMQATSGSGITTTDAVNGVFSIVLTKAQTLQLPSSQTTGYVWSFERIDGGFEDTLASGPCIIAESYYG